MNTLEILNDIRQLTIIEINPKATFQKNNNKDNKMIRIEGKTELFVNPSVTQPPINLYTNAETKIQPLIVNRPIQTSIAPIIQTPRTLSENTQIIKKYTSEELHEKKYTKPELQKILKERNLKVSGNKPELIIRILSNQ